MAENKINALQDFKDALNANGIELSDSDSEKLYDDYNMVADSNISDKEDIMKFLTTETVQQYAIENRYDEYENELHDVETEAREYRNTYDEDYYYSGSRDSDAYDDIIANYFDAEGSLNETSYYLNDMHSVIVDMVKDGSGVIPVHSAGDLTLTANDDGTFTIKTDYDEVPEYNRDDTYNSISEVIDQLKLEVGMTDSSVAELDNIVKEEYGNIDDSVDGFVNSLPDLTESDDGESPTNEIETDSSVALNNANAADNDEHEPIDEQEADNDYWDEYRYEMSQIENDLYDSPNDVSSEDRQWVHDNLVDTVMENIDPEAFQYGGLTDRELNTLESAGIELPDTYDYDMPVGGYDDEDDDETISIYDYKQEFAERVDEAMQELKESWDDDPDAFLSHGTMSISQDTYNLIEDIYGKGYELQDEGREAINSDIKDGLESIGSALADYEMAESHDSSIIDYHSNASKEEKAAAIEDLQNARDDTIQKIQEAFESYYGSEEDKADNDDEKESNSFIEKLEDAKDAIMNGISSLLDDIFGDLENDKEEDADKADNEKEQQVDNGSNNVSADTEVYETNDNTTSEEDSAESNNEEDNSGIDADYQCDKWND